MRIYVDADGCPVVDITVKLSMEFAVPCLLFCDTAHQIHRDGTTTYVLDKGADSVDYAIANRVTAGDLVITQDYGLAAMCLAKSARVLHQDGWEYHENNIGALLMTRHESRKHRAAGGRVKGPKKRTAAQNATFASALRQILQKRFQG